ncbi:hypothetical protein [Bradyrhizobium sp. URHC0002]
MPTAMQDINPAFGNQGTKRPPHRDQLRDRDMPAVSRPDDEPMTVCATSYVVRGQPVAAGKDLENAAAEGKWPSRETSSGLI